MSTSFLYPLINLFNGISASTDLAGADDTASIVSKTGRINDQSERHHLRSIHPHIHLVRFNSLVAPSRHRFIAPRDTRLHYCGTSLRNEKTLLLPKCYRNRLGICIQIKRGFGSIMNFESPR